MTNPIKRIQEWWGGYIPEPDPNSRFVFIGFIYPTPRVYWERLKKHIKAHWEFWGGIFASILLTLIGLLFNSK